MTIKSALALVACLTLQVFSAFAQGSNTVPATTAPAVESSPVPAHSYDPARNATEDIDTAIKEAQRAGKRVLLEIGGDWCAWCHSLAQFFDENAEVRKLRDDNFVTVSVYYGTDQRNDAALSRYSKVLGIPHFFVLDSAGNELYSQHVVELESDGKYDVAKMKSFLQKWSPQQPKTLVSAAPTVKN